MTHSSEPVLDVCNYSKSYGAKRVVNNVSLTVNAGQIFGFVGHNGAGKTTLIRSIVGASSFTSGDIRICGLSVRDRPVACKAVTAYVSDNPDIYSFLTGAQYLAYMANMFAVPQDVRAERIQRYAGLLQIDDRLGELISAYSHGMRQKLVLVGAFLHNPRLLVLDEPFVGLDPQASYNLKTLMREHVASGAAIFFSSHVLEVVQKLCDEVAIIRAGSIVTCGPTNDVCGDATLEQVFFELANDQTPATHTSAAPATSARVRKPFGRTKGRDGRG